MCVHLDDVRVSCSVITHGGSQNSRRMNSVLTPTSDHHGKCRMAHRGIETMARAVGKSHLMPVCGESTKISLGNSAPWKCQESH